MNVALTAPDATGGVARYADELRAALREGGRVTVSDAGRLRTPDDADVLHVTAPRVADAAVLAGPTPTVLTVHGLDAYWPPRFRASLREPAAWLQQRLLPGLARRADRVIVPSAFLRDELCDKAGFDPDRVRVVPHGVSEVFRRPARRGQAYLVTTTPTRPVIEALAAVQAAGHDTWLVVAGERGYGYGDAVEHAERLGVRQDVAFVGSVNDALLATLYADALAYVHWSAYESFGLPPLEAAAAGTPVVTTPTGAIPEVMGDAASNADTADGLAVEIRRLASDSTHRTERSVAGRERSTRFTWARTARETAAVYEEVVA